MDRNRVLACLCKGKGEGVEESSLQVEELTLNVKLGKRLIDRDMLRAVLDGTTRLRKLKVEDVGVETRPGGCRGEHLRLALTRISYRSTYGVSYYSPCNIPSSPVVQSIKPPSRTSLQPRLGLLSSLKKPSSS